MAQYTTTGFSRFSSPSLSLSCPRGIFTAPGIENTRFSISSVTSRIVMLSGFREIISSSSRHSVNFTSPSRRFSATKPSIFTGSLAAEYGGAYASSSSVRSYTLPPFLTAADRVSIRLSTPSCPTIWAPYILPSGPKAIFRVMLVAPG